MNLEQNSTSPRDVGFVRFSWVYRVVFSVIWFVVLSASFVGAKSQSAKPTPSEIEKQFAGIVAALADAQLDDAPTIEKLEQSALKLLDTEVVSALPVATQPALDALNARLAKFMSREAGLGESYRVIPLGGQPATYALLANFGLGSPSAIRLYTEQGGPSHFVLAARIDRSTQEDFLDDSLELVPIASPGVVFMTVAGRTDAEQTGVFIAWQFDDPQRLKQIWTSDLVEQSSYQVDLSGFQLTYCNIPDQNKPGQCRGMVRDRYRLQDGQWRKVESTPVPVPKR
jgi:hypothetical protein